MSTDTSPDAKRELIILEHVEYDPDVTQASLAAQLGVAVGTVNWHIKRLVNKGFIKVKRAQRKKLRYIITPAGISHRAELTVNYIDSSMRLYRRTRLRVRELLKEVKLAGYEQVQIAGDGDIADICRLTCLEQGITVIENPAPSGLETLQGINKSPVLSIQGMHVSLQAQDGNPLGKPDSRSSVKRI